MKKIKNLYIHFPFCFKKCHFCDFSINALFFKEHTENIRLINNQMLNQNILIKNYLENLELEFKHFIEFYNHKLSEIETIYIGGGTPSLLNENNVEKILNSINKNFKVNINQTEIILEADPNTFNSRKLKNLFSMGIRKINLGIQTFNDDILREMNRSHNLKDSFEALENLIDSDFKNSFGIELLQGLPTSNELTIRNDLQEIIMRKYHKKIPHISVSQLSFDNINVENYLSHGQKKIFYDYSQIHQNINLVGLLHLEKFIKFKKEFNSDDYQEKLADYYTLTDSINLPNFKSIDHFFIF